MTKTARVYGGSLYDLAAEEKLDGQIMEQMIAVRQIFRENLGESEIPAIFHSKCQQHRFWMVES